MDDKKRTEIFQYKPGDTLSLGVTRVSGGVQFAVSLPDKKQCFLNLYRKGQKKPACRIPLTREYKRGSVYFITICGVSGREESGDIAEILSNEYEYMYEADGEELIDPYAAAIHGRERWGRRTTTKTPGEKEFLRGAICLEEFDWQGDSPLGTDFSDMILYQLHVRGYTKHRSSGVEHRGTYAGLKEKIPYLKELGINAVLLLPVYEFDEVQSGHSQVVGQPRFMKGTRTAHTGEKQDKKLNYWGYGGGDTYYFAPKASYAADSAHAGREFKELVRSMHQAGIEVLMDIYFKPGSNVCIMEDCLRSWVLEYHIDGFRVNQEVAPSLVLVSDPILSGVKLLGDYWDVRKLGEAGVLKGENALAEYNEGFMNCARRFLKSDEGQVEGFAGYFQRNAKNYSVINFMTYVNGFTMMDLVSYDVKHNEENGEMNQDGTQYNYSWNCGVEGKSRKRYIVSRRMCQIRNAFAMMLLAQGTPMILAGDEFGNTQGGNNNPYCQDNAVTWLDWRQLDTYQDIYQYVKKMIAFRKEHPVLHQKEALLQYDSLSCGMPDISLHGMQAWRTDYSYYSRMLAVLLYGEYEKKEDGSSDDSIYIIFNMYWEARSFDLPNLPGNREWYPAIETYGNTFSEIPKPVKRRKKVRKPSLESQKKTVVPPRSIVVFVGR